MIYQSFLDCTSPFTVGVHTDTPAAPALIANTGMQSEICKRCKLLLLMHPFVFHRILLELSSSQMLRLKMALETYQQLRLLTSFSQFTQYCQKLKAHNKIAISQKGNKIHAWLLTLQFLIFLQCIFRYLTPSDVLLFLLQLKPSLVSRLSTHS